jgi:hypothetical protein
VGLESSLHLGEEQQTLLSDRSGLIDISPDGRLATETTKLPQPYLWLGSGLNILLPLLLKCLHLEFGFEGVIHLLILLLCWLHHFS